MASLRSFLSLFDGYSADYAPYESPEAKTRDADVVVYGTLVEIREGRVLFAETMDSPEAAQALALEVKVDDVYKGPADLKPGEALFVELPSGGRGADEFRAELPRGARVALYLSPAVEEKDAFVVGQDGQGRPEGAELWSPLPEGLLIEARDGVAYPLEAQAQRDVALDQLMP